MKVGRTFGPYQNHPALTSTASNGFVARIFNIVPCHPEGKPVLRTVHQEEDRQGSTVDGTNETGATSRICTQKDEMLRFCVNYLQGGATRVWDAYHTPLMGDCIDQLGESRIFSTRDANGSCSELEIVSVDRDKTAFISYHGLFLVNRMSLGPKNSPEYFHVRWTNTTNTVYCRLRVRFGQPQGYYCALQIAGARSQDQPLSPNINVTTGRMVYTETEKHNVFTHSIN